MPVTLLCIVAHLLLLQDVLSSWVSGQVNHAFWSIAVEWHLYFLFPILILLWRRIGPAGATLAAGIVGYIVHFLLLGTPFAGLTAYYLALFVSGIVAAYLVFSPDIQVRDSLSRIPSLGIATGLSLTSAYLCARWGWKTASQRFGFLDLLMGLATAFVLLSICRPQSPVATWLREALSSRWLVKIGLMSYIYI